MFRIFSHSTPVHFSWNCESGPKLRKSFIYHLCMPWCPTSKTDLTLECQTLQSASWRNSNGNRFVCWAFCAPWTWKQTECFPLTFLGQHIMLLAKLAGESQRHWADSLPLICNPEKNIAVCFAVQHLALIWTNQNTNHGVKQNDQCALCPCQELTIRIEGKHMGPGANLQKAGKRPCEAFYHPKQMSHGMLQSSKCCVGTCVGSLLPSQATRHWFVAAQWHASDTPTFQYITYLQASLYCAELVSMRFHQNCKSHSFIICVWLGVQHLKLIWNAKHGKPAWWKNSNGNRFVCWAFCAPWTWKQTECFPLTCLGQHIMLLAKLAPISSYPALIRCRSVACFRRPNFSIHYIPSGIRALCWTHANGV